MLLIKVTVLDTRRINCVHVIGHHSDLCDQTDSSYQEDYEGKTGS